MDATTTCSRSCSSSSSCGSSSSMVPPRSPKSSPPPQAGGLDLFGKRRHFVKVQVLEREIAWLQEELKSVESLQPASRCCKELDDFIGTKQDPLVAIRAETQKSRSSWKWLCFPWICCFNGCRAHLEMPNCCAGCCPPCKSCSCSHLCSCWEKMHGRVCCESIECLCPCVACCCFYPLCSQCTKVNPCSRCSRTCCNPCRP